MELVYDADITVKIEAINLLCKITPFLNEQTIKSRITNFFIEIIQSINEEVVKIVSFQIGKILVNVYNLILKLIVSIFNEIIDFNIEY